ncbi:MAG TPA: S8 family serine peptidase, partial [Candidatus Limnocylindrales bacterium]|nr:S8 family serine peptidase [Candidatus Limnocylindrales bacterium]
MAPRTFALRSSLSLRPWLTAGAVISLVAGMVIPATTVAAAAPPTRAGAAFTASPLGSGSQRYIAILRNQNTTMAANSASRLSLIKSQQAPVVSRLRSAGGHLISSTHLINAVIATMTASQAAALAADPDVAQVIPDGVIPGPNPLSSAPLGARSSVKPSAALPACGTPTTPELDPEALTNINAVQAQAAGFTGTGVKVAYLADGVDAGNADFQRNAAYASSGSPAGSSMLTQVDFAGDPAGTPTGGAEAFGDASSIGAQGNQAYDLSTYVNTTHPLPAGCDIKIVGVAPGASILALKVFAEDNDTTTSNFLQAIDYAVANGAKVINESFGSNNIPDTSLDVVREADDAAVAAGVTVVVSTGDAGITGTNGSPATDPNVISVGASTTFRSYTQETFGGINDPSSNGKYVDNNISSLSSGGFNQSGGTLDLVAPGDLNWALCSTNITIYDECTDENGNPSPIQNFGGTSESSPLTAGAAAVVISAYASAHHGNYPTPALVKQILVSTATDIGAPATEQGAGLLNVMAAVKMALSINSSSSATSGNVLVGPSQINIVQQPGDSTTEAFKLTNPNSSPIKVNLSTRALTHQVADHSGTFCLQPGTPTADCPANTGAFPIWSGVVETYQDEHFTVPHTSGLSRLDFTADYQYTGQSSLLHVALFEPDGTYAGYSLPQGLADFARIEVANPPAGTWTAVFFTVQDGDAGIGTSGPIQWDASTLEYRSGGSVYPSSLTIGAGQTATAFLNVHSPSTAGDSEQSIVVNTATAQTTIPVTVRTLVHMGKNGGTFSGVLTGGNGRATSYGQTNTYFFDVPAGKSDMDISFALADDPGDFVIGTLVDPHGQTVGYSSNVTSDADFNPAVSTTMSIYHVAPSAGRWHLTLDFQNPVNGTELTEPFTGAIRFNQV